jgi:hypothetical protein
VVLSMEPGAKSVGFMESEMNKIIEFLIIGLMLVLILVCAAIWWPISLFKKPKTLCVHYQSVINCPHCSTAHVQAIDL